MKRIFYPASIVVIGVSDQEDNLARNILGNLLTFEYSGELYAVGRRPGEVYGIPISDSLDHLPDNVDLAVILTPAAVVLNFVELCGQKGIKRVVVESGGFSEFSEEGRQLEEELLELIHKWDMRLVGPNCISVVNLETGVCLPFAPIMRDMTHLGPASIIAQSGGVSITYMGMLSHKGVGVNKTVSIGNKADLDETDYLEYMIEDQPTEMICMYLESISNGRKLMDLASGSPKPIVIHKANRSHASQSVAFSHTAALANDDRIVEAAFKQAGILRAEGFQDLVSMAQGLTLPPVKGEDLVIISRSGGHAVTAADFAEQYGFSLPPLPESFIDAVQSFFRADVIALTNPLDLGVVFDFEIYAQIVEMCLNALSPDAILLINTYTHAEEEGALRLAKHVGEIVHRTKLPIAFCVYADTAKPGEIARDINLPVFDSLENALRGLSCSRQWQENKKRNNEKRSYISSVPAFIEADKEKVSLFSLDHALDLCGSFDIPIAPWKVAKSTEGVVQAAQEIGFPVALKILSSEISHKTDVQGVVLNIGDPLSVREQAEALFNRIRELMVFSKDASILVQKMTPGGLELILGGKRDPTFGPVVMYGLGGINVEVFDDVAFRVVPFTREDACQMIAEVRGSKLLDGYRGGEPIDRDSIVQILLSLSRMMVENPTIVEIDLNPVIASSKGLVAVDARIMGAK